MIYKNDILGPIKKSHADFVFKSSANTKIEYLLHMPLLQSELRQMFLFPTALEISFKIKELQELVTQRQKGFDIYIQFLKNKN